MDRSLDMLPRGPMVWNLGRASQRSKDLNFGRASQRSDGLKFGHASQRSDGLEYWTCFLEVPRLNFGCASQRSMDLNLDMLPRGPMD